jgi:hypothetical protein
VVRPILLYGCELWGLSNCDIVERVYLKYCKLLLNFKSSTPNCKVLPLYQIIQVDMI